MLSESDATFIDNLSTRVITTFRNDTFPKDFIDRNPQIFLNFEWINVSKLKIFIESQSLGARDIPVKTEHVAPIIIKNEPDLDEQRRNCVPRVTGTSSGTRTSRNITGHEVIEILSDSEDERPVPKMENVSVVRTSSGEKIGERGPGIRGKTPSGGKKSLPPFDPSMFTEESDTIWTDSKVTSFALEGRFQVTKEVRVDRVEYLADIPCVWPIPKIQTAFILDLRDDAKYLVYKEAGNTMTPVTPDFLLKSMDQDSWKGGTGVSDSTAQVTFQQGFPPITCRRSRLTCKGAYACSGIDPALLNVERHDLDPVPRLRIFEAQKSTRVDERSSVEQRAATFLNVCRSRCPAVDSSGNACTGKPKMKEKSKAHSGHGQTYFIACNGWTKSFNAGHQTHTIPGNVNEDILAKLMDGRPLDTGSDTNLCSLLISSHIGLKQVLCPHPHIQGGRSDKRFPIKNYPCSASRTIYIPIDPLLRFALIVHKHIPRNHPMPKIDKASFETKSAYRKCVEAVGILGATVQKVDQASSTSVLLGGKTPGQYDSSLLNGRIKQDLISGAKKKKSPAGNGETGVYHLYLEECNKPVEERYIQSFINTPDGGTLIFTCVPSLLNLIHEVTSFECDVTFKRVQTLNEWEMVIYYPPIERAITIARVYINKADTNYYTILFDELQGLTLRLTGKPLRFKRFSPDGNLLCMNADMEAAQILGAGRSFMKTNNVAYSEIDVNSPEELLPFFVRVCLTHSKRGVLDFKFLVTADDYRRILNFPYMKSQAELDEFTLFITSLGIKKIQDWWNHKIKSAWIIPCILGSQSKIFPEHWSTTPATTNVGESQHHWSNKLTGIGLPLLEGIQTARRVDEQVADEVVSSLRTGILKNKQTNLFHQQNRANQRLLSTARKTRKDNVLHESLSSLQSRVEDEKAARQQSLHRQREISASLKTLTENGSARMSITLFEETSQLRKKIDYEKDLQRRSTITQTSLVAELSELSASASGKPAAGVSKRLPKVFSEDMEASSSGRVSAAFVRAMSDTLATAPDYLASRTSNSVPLAMVGDFEHSEVAHSYFDDAENFEEEDDPEATFGEADLSSPSDHPRPDHSKGPANIHAISQHKFLVPTTYEFSNGDTINREEGERPQQPLAFENDSNIYGSEFRNSSLTALLMNDDDNFDFGFDFIGNSSHVGGRWAPYRSTTASSSGEDLSTYNYGGLASETYSSSEGKGGYSSIYDPGHWNSVSVDFSSSSYSEPNDVEMEDNRDMILPIPRIPTSSPPASSPPPAQHQLADTESYTLKRPRAPVAAELDTANILPSEHRRKRMKPARVTHAA